jgi:glycosyltransferase involved in cell wall biosynthesis
MKINLLRIIGRYRGGQKTNLDALDTHLSEYPQLNSVHVVHMHNEELPSVPEQKKQFHTIATQGENVASDIYLNLGYLLKAAEKIKEAIRNHKINIMHIHSPHLPIGNVAAYIAWRENIPIVLTYHGGKRRKFIDNIAIELLALFPKTVANKKISVSDAGRYLLGSETVVIDTPIGDDFFLQESGTRDYFSRLKTNGEQIVFYPARITPLKGQQDAIKAAQVLRSNGFEKGYKIILSGDSYDDKYTSILKKQISQSNLEDTVTVTREIPFSDMPAAYRSSQIQIFPTYEEGLGKIIIEAGLQGVPTIGNNVGGVPEVISDNHNGFLVKPGRIRMLADKIHFLLTHPDKSKEFGVNARYEFAQRFNNSLIARKHMEIYSDILSN